MIRQLLPLPAVFLLASCAATRVADPVPHPVPLEGSAVTQQLNSAGTVLAILTRDGDVYRLYLQGVNPPMTAWEMVRTTQHDSAPRLTWWPGGNAALENACGGTFNLPHAQEHYPVPDAEKGPGIGISNKECFR